MVDLDTKPRHAWLPNTIPQDTLGEQTPSQEELGGYCYGVDGPLRARAHSTEHRSCNTTYSTTT